MVKTSWGLAGCHHHIRRDPSSTTHTSVNRPVGRANAGIAAWVPTAQQMCCCCCPRLHRHQIHLISYGCVSFGLITTGLVFTVFSIFQKDSQIGKVWLAGPTTMVVGLVLCGKVIIDWGPAMLHAREGSIDSRLMDQMSNPVLNRMGSNSMMRGVGYPGNPVRYEEHPQYQPTHPHLQGNGSVKSIPPVRAQPTAIPLHGPPPDAVDCIIYSQYEPPLSNLNGVPGLGRVSKSELFSPRASSSATPASPAHSDVCECAKYGSIRRPTPQHVYQGENFVLNERNYLI